MTTEQELGRAVRCKHPDKSHKLCVGGCVGVCKRVNKGIDDKCPKHEIDGVGPCYCQPPLRKITFNMKDGQRVVTTDFSSADAAIVGLGLLRDDIRTINSVKLAIAPEPYRYVPGPTKLPEFSFRRQGLPAEALDALGIKAGDRTRSIEADALRRLVNKIEGNHTGDIENQTYFVTLIEKEIDLIERGEL
jgi:hypothetical protein